MKKTAFGSLLLLVFSLLAANAALAAEPVMASEASGAIDKNRLEGWIVGIDYRNSHFQLLDPRGFQKRVVTKLGMIGDYRIGDRVRVEIDPDYDRARMIEKLYS